MKSLKLTAVIAMLLSGAMILGINLSAKEKGPGGPPPQIEACKSKKAGDACSFKTREGSTKTDTCKQVTTPKGKELSCGEMEKPPMDGKNPPREK